MVKDFSFKISNYYNTNLHLLVFRYFNLFFVSFNPPIQVSLSQRSAQFAIPQYAYAPLLALLKYAYSSRFLVSVDLCSWLLKPFSPQVVMGIFFLPQLSLYFNLICLGSHVSSAEPLFFNFWWLEREVSEMSGIFFFNKLDTRNLLMEYFNSLNPLLKSFPVTGFDEIFFNHLGNLIVVIPTTFQI